MKLNPFRENFLNNQWLKYPDASDLKMAGRVVELSPNYLTILRVFPVNRKPTHIQLSFKALKDELKEAPKIEKKNELVQWQKILVIGDIFGIQKNGKGVLLSPNQLDEAALGSTEDILIKVKQQKKWNLFLDGVNEFFRIRKFLSVSTPSLVVNPGSEPSIDTFKTMYRSGSQQAPRFLITSPELHLKKIVSELLSPIYEITKVFRNNEHSPQHQPEFCMLEWYRPFSNLHDLERDVKDLIVFLIKKLNLKIAKPKFESTTFRKILKEKYHLNFTPNTTPEQIKKWLKKQNIYFSPTLGLDDLFTLMNLEMIETSFNKKTVVFISDYPPYAAALAKVNQEGWAQRFEVYWKDLELGNAFYELNDPIEQESRFKEDNLKKKKNDLEALPIDKEFLKCLKKGLPPTAGISIGLERLFMALFDESEIKNLKWFPQH